MDPWTSRSASPVVASTARLLVRTLIAPSRVPALPWKYFLRKLPAPSRDLSSGLVSTLTVNFPKWTNSIPTVLAAIAAVAGAVVVCVVWYWFSPYHIEVGYSPKQPILYSHKLHAGVMGMDCRYCHQGVEKGPHATVPTTETCMNCHKTVHADKPEIKKLAKAHAEGQPVEWVKVHMLPDYAYFDHSVHVKAGVGCASCHGRIDQQEEVRQVEPLSMGWCLECHRNPAPHLRPLDKVTDMKFQPDEAEGAKFMIERNINPPQHCSACHR